MAQPNGLGHTGAASEKGELAFAGMGGEKADLRAQVSHRLGQVRMIGKGVDGIAGKVETHPVYDNDVAQMGHIRRRDACGRVAVGRLGIDRVNHKSGQFHRLPGLDDPRVGRVHRSFSQNFGNAFQGADKTAGGEGIPNAADGFGPGVVVVGVGEQDKIRGQRRLVQRRLGVDEAFRGALAGKVGVNLRDSARGVLQRIAALLEPMDSHAA